MVVMMKDSRLKKEKKKKEKRTHAMFTHNFECVYLLVWIPVSVGVIVTDQVDME